MIVIFEDAEHVVQLRAGDENHAHPMRNHPSGAKDWLAVVEGGELLIWTSPRFRAA